MRSIEFCNDAFSEFSEWATLDKTIFRRLVRIIEETKREPFGGIGKPEPLKGNLSGKWSKRINDEHRLVYEVRENSIVIFSCRDHY
jgi:toxin YoeB